MNYLRENPGRVIQRNKHGAHEIYVCENLDQEAIDWLLDRARVVNHGSARADILGIDMWVTLDNRYAEAPPLFAKSKDRVAVAIAVNWFERNGRLSWSGGKIDWKERLRQQAICRKLAEDWTDDEFVRCLLHQVDRATSRRAIRLLRGIA